MYINLVHLVSSIDRINFGVWNAVVSSFDHLQDLNCVSFLFFPDSVDGIPERIKRYNHEILENEESQIFTRFSIENTIIISHGNWTQPTKTGYNLKKQGYKWIAVPHGMLEPWSMNHKKWKKKLYFTLFEKRMLSKADALIAVGEPEYKNLRKVFGDKVVHIPNGINPFNDQLKKSEEKRIFLFMGRLHSKKGVVPLVQAWMGSRLSEYPDTELWIAGPDEGELAKIERMMKEQGARGRGQGARSKEQGAEGEGQGVRSGSRQQQEAESREQRVEGMQLRPSNVKILGPVYGEKKEDILKAAHFFVLPSQSEGFPTSIIESMTYGCVPIITKGCNFPEAIEEGVAIETEFDVQKIREALEFASLMSTDVFSTKSGAAKKFADQHYNLEKVAKDQYELYRRVLGTGC